MAKRNSNESSPEANPDTIPSEAVEAAAGVVTSAATASPAVVEATSATPAGESAPAGAATEIAPQVDLSAFVYRVTPKDGEQPYGVNSPLTAHTLLAEGNAVFNQETKKELSLPPEKPAPAPKKAK